MYHYSPRTGNAEKCTATEGQCPYVHGDDPETTVAKAMEAQKLGALPTASSRANLAALRQFPFNVLAATPLKKLDASQLTQTLRAEAELSGLNVGLVDSAISLASILHAHQTRGNRGAFNKTPYIEHPLRNSLRLLRLGVTDESVIVASVLHDTIEDGAKIFAEANGRSDAPELEARRELSDYIGKAYGARTQQLVEAVTNDYMEDTTSRTMASEEKNAIYLAHVRKNVEGNPGALLVKVSDFIDNAGSLHHTTTSLSPEGTARRARKYLPVVEVLMNELRKTPESLLPSEGKRQLHEQLAATKTRLEAFANAS